jgi:hypothetical protein
VGALGEPKFERTPASPNTLAKRLSLVAGYRVPYETPRGSQPEPHEVTPLGELVRFEYFFLVPEVDAGNGLGS